MLRLGTRIIRDKFPSKRKFPEFRKERDRKQERRQARRNKERASFASANNLGGN